MRRFVGAVLVVTVVACTPGGERDVDRSEDGATATAGAVSITYPSDFGPLAIDPASLVAGWNEAFVGSLGGPEAVATADRIVAGSGLDPISLEAVVDSDEVSVAQFALVNGANDDDQTRSADAVQKFLELMLRPIGGDTAAASAGLGFGESGVLFGLSENEYVIGSMTFYRASNEDTILIGVVGSP